MIRSMVNMEDFVSYLREREERRQYHDFFFDIEKMVKFVSSIQNHRFAKINFRIGSKTWFLREKESLWSGTLEVDLFGERFLNFGYVIYRMEQGDAKNISYYSDGWTFQESFLKKILSPEYKLSSKQVIDLYQSF